MTKIISIVGGMQPSAPTIGTATADDTTASVAFTPSTYIGKGTITYTATSSPGGFTATGSSSPLTVTGLTNGTAYTFTVVGTTNYGVSSASSAASNSVTPDVSTSYNSLASAVGSGTNTITFSSISNTYKHLQLRGNLKTTGGSTSFTLAINGGVTTYPYNAFYASNSGSSLAAAANPTNEGYISFVSIWNVANMPILIDIQDANSTTKFKTVRIFGGYHTNGSYTPAVWFASFAFATTSAVSSITLRNTGYNFDTGNLISLYGIKG